MRQVQEVLRLLLVCGLSQRQASEACGIGRATVAEYLVRAQRAGVLERAWETWSGEELEQRLYPAVRRPARRERPEVDWLYVHNELKLKGVTLSLVWQEHREQYPTAYQYSRFCELTGRGGAGWTSACARCTGPARSCSWTTAVRRCRSSTPGPARCGMRRSSSRW